MEKWKNSDTVYDGTVFRVKTGTVTLDDGTIAQREVVEHPGGVGVVPFDGTHVILVRQYRIAIGQEILEIPAGKKEGEEDPAACGMRELIEETGYRAETMVSAGSVFATVGYCSEKIHLYLAFDLTHVGQNLDEEERIELVKMTLDDVRAGLKEHRFEDAKTVVALHALLQHLAG